MTDHERKESFITTMGQKTGGLFYLVENQVCELQIKFSDFKELFGKDEKTINILNQASSSFFGKLQILMNDDINLVLSRLLDKSKKTGSFPHLLNSLPNKQLRKELKAEFTAIEEMTTQNKKLRDSRLAHTSGHQRLSSNEQSIYISRSTIQDVLHKMYSILNTVRNKYEMSQCLYSVFDDLSSSKSILYRIEEALKYENLQWSGRLRQNNSKF